MLDSCTSDLGSSSVTRPINHKHPFEKLLSPLKVEIKCYNQTCAMQPYIVTLAFASNAEAHQAALAIDERRIQYKCLGCADDQTIASVVERPLTHTQALDVNEFTGAVLNVFTELTSLCFMNAMKKGFWDKPCNDGERLALLHSEISEVLEAMRDGNPSSVKIPAYSSAEEELADLIIRALDYAGGKGWDIGGAILAKMQYNSSRPHLHGRKF
jgi:NTP pyrophosphatase (non-canonical NTP hydrolase)